MPPRRSASSRNANGAANGNVKKEKEVPVVATIDDGDDETEEMAEIELSSDEEASDDECALIVLKRPPVTERTVEEVEVITELFSLSQQTNHTWAGYGG